MGRFEAIYTWHIYVANLGLDLLDGGEVRYHLRGGEVPLIGGMDLLQVLQVLQPELEILAPCLRLGFG